MIIIKEDSHRLLSWLIKDGKKGKALKILKKVNILLKIETGQNPDAVIIKAIDNIKPIVGLRTYKKANLTYLLPYILKPRKSEFLALKWLFKHCKKRNERKFHEKLAGEIKDAFNNEGSCIKEKARTYELANQNRVYLQVFFKKKK